MASGKNKASKPENQNAANKLVATFMAEVKDSSGWTNSQIAEALDTDENSALTEIMISQYLNGKRAMSKRRLLQFARRAEELGLNTPSVEKDLQWDKSFPAELLEESARHLKDIDKSISRSQKAALEQLEKSVDRLVQLDWSDKNIIGSVIMLTRKLIPSDELTHGGTVNVAWLWKALGGKKADYPVEAWLDWSFRSLDEHAAFLKALDAQAKSDIETKPTQTRSSGIKSGIQSKAKRSSIKKK